MARARSATRASCASRSRTGSRAMAAALSAIGVERRGAARWLAHPVAASRRDAPGPTAADHRIAMAFGRRRLAGVVAKSVDLDDPGCVDVSYPSFWRLDRARQLGVGRHETAAPADRRRIARSSCVGILEGLPAGLRVSTDHVNRDLRRRQHGYGSGRRMLIEKDRSRVDGRPALRPDARFAARLPHRKPRLGELAGAHDGGSRAGARASPRRSPWHGPATPTSPARSSTTPRTSATCWSARRPARRRRACWPVPSAGSCLPSVGVRHLELRRPARAISAFPTADDSLACVPRRLAAARSGRRRHRCAARTRPRKPA